MMPITLSPAQPRLADRGTTHASWRLLAPVLTTLLLAACAPRSTLTRPTASPAQVQAEVRARLPADVPDKDGWARDIQRAFAALKLDPSVSHLCAALAVTAQESSFSADPVVPHLGTIALKAIHKRAARHHIPGFAVDAALRIHSPDGQSYATRIRQARTEGQLSRIYEDLIARVPLGRHLFADDNPVRTGGPMQVSVRFAERWAAHHDYPYAPRTSVRREVFTRRGGLYFGIAHLLAKRVSYDSMLYRFADYNAGFYASRNAAFQNAVNVASGSHLVLDGDLVSYADHASATEKAVRRLGPRLGLSDGAIHDALKQGETFAFERTGLYHGVFNLADRAAGKPLPRAILPRITLESPKITRRLTTAWFAHRVDQRYRACLH
ncbi:MAG TPA: DUF1615 domain-containing protein [Rhodanobacteraceae bacterium]